MANCSVCGKKFGIFEKHPTGRCQKCEEEYQRQEEERQREERHQRAMEIMEEQKRKREEEQKRKREETHEKAMKVMEEQKRKHEEESQRIQAETQAKIDQIQREKEQQKQERAAAAEEYKRLHPKENHKVSGTSFHEDEIRSLLQENPIYDSTKSELIDDGFIDEYIYQYSTALEDLTLKPEPNNLHDKNAIMVLVSGKHIGYIKSGSCSHVKNLIDSERIDHANVFIGGGNYKIIHSEYDWEKDKDKYTLEKGEKNFTVELTLYLKPEDDQSDNT